MKEVRDPSATRTSSLPCDWDLDGLLMLAVDRGAVGRQRQEPEQGQDEGREGERAQEGARPPQEGGEEGRCERRGGRGGGLRRRVVASRSLPVCCRVVSCVRLSMCAPRRVHLRSALSLCLCLTSCYSMQCYLRAVLL